MAIATVGELSARVQADVDPARGQLLLDIAEDWIVAEVGVLDPWPARVLGIQLDMCARVWVNPAGVTRETFETYSRAFGDTRDAPPSGMYLSDTERMLLRQAVGLSDVFSVRLRTPADRVLGITTVTGD